MDSEGNQLPYIDRVVYDLVDNDEVLLLRALNGEIDFHGRHINTLGNKPVFFDYMEQGNYRLIDQVPTEMNEVVIAFNMTHEDPVKREIFNNKDFRIGLSYAINREEIVDLVFVGQGEPWQAAPLPEVPFFNEQLAKQYTEYDVELANEYLDRAGYAQRDAAGFRLGPDGNRISFAVEIMIFKQERVDILELVQGYWREVGIDMQVRPQERSLWQTRAEANLPDASAWSGNNGAMDALLSPIWFVPVNTSFSLYGIPWALWYHGDTRGEEPPVVIQEQMDLYDQVKATPDEAKQMELMAQIMEIAADQFYAIGTARLAPFPAIATNRMRNIPDSMIYGGSFMEPGYTRPEQFFISIDAQ